MQQSSQEQQIILSMDNITKVYGNGIMANKDVTFSVRKGEIHALAGENGAGKSTLMKILFGIERHDFGDIRIDGQTVTIDSPTSAIAHGIGMVHQHFMLVPSLTVAENIVLGYEPGKFGFIDKKSIYTKTKEISTKYNLLVNPRDVVADLAVGTKQKIEILKALIRDVRILILDEPTAVLTPQETSELFAQLIKLKEDGYTIIFISHKLNEIKQICDRITIMRSGRSQGTFELADMDTRDISKLMVGRDMAVHIDKKPPTPGEEVLRVKDLVAYDETGKQTLKGVNMRVRRGEILGIAGVEGNGQRELIDRITGLAGVQGGDIILCGESIANKSINKIRKQGIAHIPEDRMVYGAAAEASISDNLISDRSNQKRFNNGPLQNTKAIVQQADQLIKEFRIKTDISDRAVGMLSGGNIQKVVVAREMTSDHSLLVADQPSRGIDVGAARFIHERLISMRDDGKAILLVSADINEVLELSDSLIIFYNGNIVAYFESIKELDEEEMGLYMLGIKQHDEETIGRVAQ